MTAAWTPSRPHIVIAGGSLAGTRAAASLRELGFAGRLTLIDGELHGPYDRPPLSKGFLTHALAEADIRLREVEGLAVTWRRGRRAVSASVTDRTVQFDDGTTLSFDGLIIATGARPRDGGRTLTNAPEAGANDVLVLRSLADAARLRSALSARPGRVVVVGAGFIGTEVAATARKLGIAVTLIDAAPVPLLHAVGHTVGAYVADLHRKQGVDLRLGVGVRELHVRGGRIGGVVLDDDTVLPAGLVVLGLGAIPNVDWLSGSGALVDGGVCTDASLRVLSASGDPIRGVAAAGDVARFPHPLFDKEPVRLEHWSNAIDHAKVAARTVLADLTGAGEATPYAGIPSFWSDQYDRKLMSVGLPHLGDQSAVLEGQVEDDRFVVGFGRRGRMVGAVGVASVRSLAAYRRIIARRGQWPPPVNSPPHLSAEGRRPALNDPLSPMSSYRRTTDDQ